MIRGVICLWAVSVLGAPAFAAEETEKPFAPANDVAELQERLRGILKAQKVPGMAVTIANRAGIVWTAGLGTADVATGRPVTPETLFRIQSISKTFAALAVLKLVEQGKISLDAPVRSVVPDVEFTNEWEATDPVRIVHLLEHTTGWDDIHPKEDASNDPKPVTLAEALALGPESRTSRWRPGTRYSYCNSGPAVTAAIVEKVTGQRFEDYVEETFFKPIGMLTADYFYSPRARALLTKQYQADGHTPYPYWHFLMRASGAVNASAREMGAYLRFFLRRGEVDGGGRILSRASVLRMETPVASWGAQGGLRAGYGLHNHTTLDERGFVWHGHGGANAGGLSALSYLPEPGVGYFFSINAGNWQAFWNIDRQLQAYVSKDLVAPALPPARSVPSPISAAYGGWYVPANPRAQIDDYWARILGLCHVTFEAAALRIKPLFGPSQTYVAVDDAHFRWEKASVPNLVLMNTPEGRVLVRAGVGGSVFAKVSFIRAWLQLIVTGLFVLALVTVPLFALVWGPRWIFRRLRGVPSLHVRVLPLLAWLSLAALLLDWRLCENDFLMKIAHRTVWSMAVTATTSTFAVFSFASLWAAVRARRQKMNRWIYYHSLAVAVVFVIATLYLARFGVIGYRSWA
jgi:CubicO group peptidase (beta-lactamase class C family)